MKIADEIMARIGDARFVVAPVTETSNLYTDVGYDSLAFVSLLLGIEDAYSVKFELTEMEMCLQTDRLITLVEQKVKESTL